MLDNQKRKLVEKLNIQDEEVRNTQDNFCVLEGESTVTNNQETFIIGDFCNTKFNFQDFDTYINNVDKYARPVMFFNDWDHERREIKESLRKQNKAADRKAVEKLFNQKIAFYINQTSEVSLSIEENGVNFLEYNSSYEGGLSGYIYNISFAELKKLFNISGKELFKENVRYGIIGNKTGELIKLSFINYFKVGFSENIQKKPLFKLEWQEILNDLCPIDKESLQYKPEDFWFYHNGVTIYSMDETINPSGSEITLNPNSTSVINGAQTLTQFFIGYEEILDELKDSINNLSDEKAKVFFENELEKIFKELIKSMYVKTIIIQGSKEKVKLVTYGLNTQIPITNESIVSDSKVTKKINDRLQIKQMKIPKDGEITVYDSVNVLTIVKMYLITEGKPGKSKNFNKDELEIYISELNSKIQDNIELLNKIKLIYDMDVWWAKSRPDRTDKDSLNVIITEDKDEDLLKTIGSNSKNYFQAFVLNYLTPQEIGNSVENDYLLYIYEEFVNNLFELSKEKANIITIGEFKKDTLFEELEYLRKKKNERLEEVDIKRDIEDNKIKIVEYVNENRRNNYSTNNILKKYFIENEIDIDEFRVVTKICGSIKEAFPFPNSTFTEIYESPEYINESPVYKEYSESKFSEAITNDFSIFVVDVDEENKKVVDLKYIQNINFNDYHENAKKVYDSTIEAFKEGNIQKFPKVSDNMDFHVRPKAKDGSDTFVFSEGSSITKRTFWANKSTIEKLVN